MMSLGGLGSKKNKSDKLKLAASAVNVGVTTASNTSANTPAASATSIAVPAVLPSTAKQMTQNIAKWSERKNPFGLDAGDEDTPHPAQSRGTTVPTQHIAVTQDKINSSVSSAMAPGLIQNASTTRTPAPASAIVCTLCQRQFSSKEQLLRHERESKLHASNLAKANLLSSSTTETSDVTAGHGHVGSGGSGSGSAGAGLYRDRASERRAVHGQRPDDVSRVVPPDTDWVCNKVRDLSRSVQSSLGLV